MATIAGKWATITTEAAVVKKDASPTDHQKKEAEEPIQGKFQNLGNRPHVSISLNKPSGDYLTLCSFNEFHTQNIILTLWMECLFSGQGPDQGLDKKVPPMIAKMPWMKRSKASEEREQATSTTSTQQV